MPSSQLEALRRSLARVAYVSASQLLPPAANLPGRDKLIAVSTALPPHTMNGPADTTLLTDSAGFYPLLP